MSCCNKNKDTLLLLAAKHGHQNVVQILLEQFGCKLPNSNLNFVGDWFSCSLCAFFLFSYLTICTKSTASSNIYEHEPKNFAMLYTIGYLPFKNRSNAADISNSSL